MITAGLALMIQCYERSGRCETRSPSGVFAIRVDAPEKTWTLERKGIRIASGTVPSTEGCGHLIGLVPNSGMWFAVWNPPRHRSAESEEPLSIYRMDGSLVKRWRLFELIPRDALGGRLHELHEPVCPAHLLQGVRLSVNELGVEVRWEGRTAEASALDVGVLPRIFCRMTDDDVSDLLERLRDDDIVSRQDAANRLRIAVLRHGIRLDQVRKRTDDPEVRARLDELLSDLPYWWWEAAVFGNFGRIGASNGP